MKLGEERKIQFRLIGKDNVNNAERDKREIKEIEEEIEEIVEMKWRKDNKNTNFSNWKDTASKEYKEILKIRFRLIKRNRGRKSSIRYKINGIIFTIKSKMWISTCENMTEFVRKYPRTKSDLRIFKISHSTEVYISEIRERIGLSKIQCLKLQTCWKQIYDICELYIYTIDTNRVYIVESTNTIVERNRIRFPIWKS